MQDMTLVARYRFEEGTGVDRAFCTLVFEALKDPQSQQRHVLLVKKAFRQMLEVRCKELSGLSLQ